MAFELWRNSVQYAQFIVLVIFSPLGVAVTVLRFVATRRSSRKVAFEDWMALVAAFFSVMTNVAGLVGMFILTSIIHHLTFSVFFPFSHRGVTLATSTLNGRDIATEVAESPNDYKDMRKV